MASQKRCLYEILGLNQDCSPEEIRTAYRKLALQRHPDKLMRTGISEEEATAAFQELLNAYEVLSDPRERSWYDSHRTKILFTEPKSSKKKDVPDLYAFFSNSVFSGFGDTGKGFYKVYGDLFSKIYEQEVTFARKLGLGLDAVRDAPLMGNLESPYTQVSAFYNYWLGFCSVMDFSWADGYEPEFGHGRKAKRWMDERNDKLRKKARKEYNDTVRGLAGFMKKRDKRVIQMQVQRNLEMEKKRAEEKARKKLEQREKLEKAMLYEEPEWAKIDEEEIGKGFEEVIDDSKMDEVKELYCVVCCKKFKSDKQWKNHEQSKKHKERVAELKYSYANEDKEEEEENLDETQEVVGPSVSVKEEEDVVVDELSEKFEEAVELQEEQTEEVKKSLSDDDEEGEEEEEVEKEEVEEDEEEDIEEDEEVNLFDVNSDNEAGDTVDSDDETRILKAMLSGHKNKKNAASKRQAKTSSASKTHVSTDNEELEFMEYDTRKKNSRRNRAAKKEAGNNSNGDPGREETSEVNGEEVVKDTQKKGRRRAAKKEAGKNSNGESGREETSEVNEEEAVKDTQKKGRRRAAKKGSGKNSNGESGKAETGEVTEEVISNTNGSKVQAEEANGHDSSHTLDSTSLAGDEVGHTSGEDPPSNKNVKDSKKPVDKRGIGKGDLNTVTKSQNTSKRKKQHRGESKSTGLLCDTCGVDFDSRNKLHKHLSDSGHATLKSR